MTNDETNRQTQFAHKYLAFYLKAYGKEEYGHEGVVDELEHGHWLSVVSTHIELSLLLYAAGCLLLLYLGGMFQIQSKIFYTGIGGVVWFLFHYAEYGHRHRHSAYRGHDGQQRLPE